MGRSSIGHGFEDIQQVPLDAFEIAHHVKIGDPNNPIAQRRKPRGAVGIGGRIGVGVAIDFDDQAFLRAEEIGDGGADGGLAAEFVAAQLRAG